jgi:hypothetical protein
MFDMKMFKNFPIWILPLTILLCAASCKNDKADTSSEVINAIPTSPATENKLIYPVRTINENEVKYPEGQEIELEAADFSNGNEPVKISFNKYEDNQLIFNGVSEWLAANPGYSYNINLDNFEPISIFKDTIPVKLKDGNHIYCIYPVDQNQVSVKSSPNASAMFRLENNELTKSADAPVLMLYNHPRRTYKPGEPVYLDYMLINTYGDESYKVDVKIDGKEFKQLENRPYLITGLKPGLHYCEMSLTGGGEPYNVPLNPARMQFTTE